MAAKKKTKKTGVKATKTMKSGTGIIRKGAVAKRKTNIRSVPEYKAGFEKGFLKGFNEAKLKFGIKDDTKFDKNL